MRLILMLAATVLVMVGCELEKDPSAEPPPAPQPPADIASDGTAAPTRDRLFFSSGRDEPDLEVYGAFANGTGRVRVTRNLEGDSGVVAYPNTGFLYYVCGRSESVCVGTSGGTGVAGVFTSQRLGFPIIEDPAISPDGSKMLFTAVRISPDGSTTNYDIHMYEFATEEITNFAVGAAQDQMPAWASDTKVVWSRQSKGDWELVTFEIGAPRGSNPVLLTNNDVDDLGVDVSQDGTKLSWIRVSGNEGEVTTMPFTGTPGTPSTVTPVRLERGFIGGDPDTALSPDGTRIAYAGVPSGEEDVEILTVPAGGGTPTNVTRNNVYDVDPDWAVLPPSFAVKDPRLHPEDSRGPLVFEITLDAPQTQALSVQYETLPGTATSGLDYTPKTGTATFSPGQTLVRVEIPVADDALIEAMETLSLRIFNSTEGTLMARETAQGRIADDDEPTPSPTPTPTPTASASPTPRPGTERIAFSSARNGKPQIFTMKTDGTDVKHVSPDQASSSLATPTWSKDGRRIIHTALNEGSSPPQHEVMDRPSDGSGGFRMLVMHPSVDAQPVYRPGSSSEAFVWASDRDGDFELYLSTPGSTTVKQLTSNTASDRSPTFSSDGRYLAYESDADGDLDIYRLELGSDGSPVGTATNLTDEEAQGVVPSDESAPDYAGSAATLLTYQSDREGDLDIMVLDTSTGEQTHVTHESSPETEPTLNASGDRVAFVRGGDIFVAPVEDAASSVNITNNPAADDMPDWSSTTVAAAALEAVSTTSSSSPRTGFTSRLKTSSNMLVVPVLTGSLLEALRRRRRRTNEWGRGSPA